MMAWRTVELGEVAYIDRISIQPEDIEPGTTYIGLEDIQKGGKIISTQAVENGELKSSKFRFGPHHLLYGKLRPYLAKIAAPDFQGICSTDIIPLLPGEEIDRQYLLHFLRQEKVVEYATSRSSGANLPRLSPKELEKLRVALPPLAEQERIATILDEADALRAKRREALAQVDTFLQSIFIEMFDKCDKFMSIGEMLEKGIIELHKDGNHGSLYPRKNEFGDSGVPFLSAKCITAEGGLVSAEVQYLCEEKSRKLKIGWVKKGDVLLAHNASVGKTCLYNGEYAEALIGTSLTAFRPNPQVLDSYFLLGALRSQDFQKQLFLNMGQTTRNQVPITAQRRLSIPVPSLELQRRFAAIVETVEQQKARMKAHLDELDALFASLQHRGFNGEL